MKRNAIKLLAAKLAMVGMASAISVSAVAADLVVGAYGGVWEQSLKECVIAPFEKKTGAKVQVTLGNPVQWMNQIAAMPDAPPLDAMYALANVAQDAIGRGIVEKLDPAKVPHLAEIPAEFKDLVDGHGAVMNYGTMGALYNAETVKDVPKDWKEFVEAVVSGKIRATIPSINYTGGGVSTLWMLASLYGGGVDNMEPGFEQVKRMRKSGNLDFWVDPNQVLNALKSGDVDMAMYWDGRAWSFINDGNDEFKYYTPQPGGIAALTVLQKVKGGSPLAWEFIDMAASAGPQSCFAQKILYGVTNTNVKYPDDLKPMITDHSLVLMPPFDKFSKHQSAWVEKWNKEIGG